MMKRAQLLQFLQYCYCLFAYVCPLSGMCPTAQIQQVDTSHYPNVRVSLLLTDSSGSALTADKPVRVRFYERNTLVYEGQAFSDSKGLAEGWQVYIVLAIDRSGSMRGPAFIKAKEAAIAYLDAAPPQYNIALVSFSDSARIESDFTTDRAQLRRKIDSLAIEHYTALQDAVGLSLKLLKDKPGRRAVLVLTDGREEYETANGIITKGSTEYAGPEGASTLINLAISEEVTVSSIGLGNQVDEAALDRYIATKGQKLHAYGPDQLRALFLKSMAYLAREQVFAYRSPFPANGRTLDLSASVFAGDASCPAPTELRPPTDSVAPGLLPHVKGNIFPYAGTVIGLLALPFLISASAAARSIHGFRSRYALIVSHGSKYVGVRDPNRHVLSLGDPIVLCPDCSCAHHVRSWRLNRCSCMQKPNGAGRYCYSQLLPSWIRRGLDALTGHRISRTGRSWLCRCAGDKDGY